MREYLIGVQTKEIKQSNLARNVHTVECLRNGVQLAISRKTLDGVVFWKIDSVVYQIYQAALAYIYVINLENR